MGATATPSPPVRPFAEGYLRKYADEHLQYEVDMFLWLSNVCGGGVRIQAVGVAETTRISNALIESFVIHLRNVIDFLYIDKPQPSDIVAADYCSPSTWALAGTAISHKLDDARTRSNKEIAHLTTARKAGVPPDKAWDFRGLTLELRTILKLFAEKADTNRLSPRLRDQLSAN